MVKSIAICELADLERRTVQAGEDAKARVSESHSVYAVSRESYARGRYGGLADAMSHLRKVLDEIKILESNLNPNQGE